MVFKFFRPQNLSKSQPDILINFILKKKVCSDIDADIAHSIVKSFVDDTRATKGIKTKTEQDAIQLQDDINKIYKWTELNNMKLNDVLRCGRNVLLKELTS